MKERGITNVNFSDELLEIHLKNPEHENAFYLEKFFEIMAVCHTIVVEEKNG
jgi:hypothetical protein